MIKFDIKGHKEFIAKMNAAANRTPDVLKIMMEYCARDVADTMKANIPKRSGSLSESVGYEIRYSGRSTEGIVGPDDQHFNGRPVGRATEIGRNPGGGFPNYFEIASRYGVSLAVGYTIAKGIYEKGTRPGLQYASRTLAKAQKLLRQYGIQAQRRIFNSL